MQQNSENPYGWISPEKKPLKFGRCNCARIVVMARADEYSTWQRGKTRDLRYLCNGNTSDFQSDIDSSNLL
jgi:hypothetical protein